VAASLMLFMPRYKRQTPGTDVAGKLEALEAGA